MQYCAGRADWVRDNLHDDSSLKHREINATHVPANAAKLNLHSALQALSLSFSPPLSLFLTLSPSLYFRFSHLLIDAAAMLLRFGGDAA